MNNLGAVYTEEERFEEAVEMLITAYRRRPRYADVHCNLGFAFLGLEQFERAIKAFNTAAELKPDYSEAYLGLARVQQEQHQLKDALVSAEKALEIDPEKSEVHSMLGSLHMEMGYAVKARQEFDKALQLDPESVRGLVGLGALQMELGELEAAEATFNRALEIDPGSMAARVSLANVRKATPGDANLQAMVDTLDAKSKRQGPRAMSLHFALGKCFDDIGDYEDAFKHFEQGCALKRATIEYDSAEQASLIDNLIKFLDKSAMERFAGAGCTSEVPVFVLGMARSGTTLTEQIIASHPDVYGAGELPDLLDLVRQPRGPEGKTLFPQSMQYLTETDISALGDQYLAGLRARDGEALRITDKMPANFLAVGLIHLMLPNARIIHVKRNPADTCLSCYSRLFKYGLTHSYDLTELGLYYSGYARLMDHWHSVLPEGAILDVVYEDLVADNEAQARRLIDFCGLPWDDACLEFHKHKRAIKTASVTQVRQPLYNTSVARWKRYEKHLGPLLEALGDLAPT
jgi:tetratricopeptide (TPR) repeat protein